MRETRLPGLFPGRCFAKGPLISASITLPLSGTYLYASQPAVSCPTHPRKKSLCFNINNNVRHVVILLMVDTDLEAHIKTSKQDTSPPGAPSRVIMHLSFIYVSHSAVSCPIQPCKNHLLQHQHKTMDFEKCH